MAKTTTKPKPAAKAAPPKPAKKLSPFEVLKRENQLLKDELAAHQKRVKSEKSLSGQVKAAEGDLEAAKNIVGSCKQALAEKQKQLADFLYGDVQTEHPDLKPKPAAPAVAAPPTRFQVLPKDQVLQVEDDAAALDQMVVRSIAQADKPTKIDKVLVKEVFGLPYLVRQGWPEEKPTRFFLQALKTKDEWQQLHEKQFGRAVEGFDQSDDVKHKRQLGGIDCGRVVIVGRIKLVLAPESTGLVLACPEPVAAAPAKVDLFDAKAAAAGEGKEPEEIELDDEDEEDGDPAPVNAAKAS